MKQMTSIISRLRKAFLNPFSVVLLLLAAISFFTDFVFASNFSKDITTVLIILLMLLVSGGIRFSQETRSERMTNDLISLVHTTVQVFRENEWIEISSEELHVGDLIRLEAGDRAPADIRLTMTKDCFVSQSAITGESGIVEKTVVSGEDDVEKTVVSGEDDVEKNCIVFNEGEEDRAFDTNMNNKVFLGSTLMGGSCEGVVTALGEDSVYGGVSFQENPKKSGYDKGENSIAWVLIRFMLLLVPIVFVASGLTKNSWLEAFLFALSVAIGLTPELLPMVCTACLARGSFLMSQKKTIVKSTNAMQGFGSIDVLCVDKTGTLTNDTVVLEYYMDVLGNECQDTLNVAFLNSFYHTGVSNHLDKAILYTRKMPGKEEHFQRLMKCYKKLDELPFDYERKYASVLVEHREELPFSRKKTPVNAIIANRVTESEHGFCAEDVRQTENNLSAENVHEIENSPSEEHVREIGNSFNAENVRETENSLSAENVREIENSFSAENGCETENDSEQMNVSRWLLVKGDVDHVVRRCRYIWFRNQKYDITEDMASSVRNIVGEMLEDGMKVLAVAGKELQAEHVLPEDEQDLTLIGYLAFFDGPKHSAKNAIEQLQKLHIHIKVLTGDHADVACSICRRLGIPTEHLLTGADFDALEENDVPVIVERTNIFAELTPKQKAQIVTVLQDNGHDVGFLGDGMNDLPAVIKANVGISVDTAADAVKECADVILLKKDLNVLWEGVLEGRKAFANMLKYIRITASSNFGNIFAIVVASVLLPFFPMTSLQLLLLNLLYGILCLVLPWDNVDEQLYEKSLEWSGRTLGRFMLFFGPISTIFDLLTFAFLYFYLCPVFCGGSFYSLDGAGQTLFVSLFQTGWFLESVWTQVLILHLLRTKKIPFVQSRPSRIVVEITIVGILLFTLLTVTPFGTWIGLTAMPFLFYVFLVGIVVLYLLLVTIIKMQYIRRYRNLF